MDALPVFDELHVISDLHLGGTKGFQIFGSTNELKSFIDWVRDRPGARVALLINGDTVDFLAEPRVEPGAEYLDPRGANRMLDRIFQDDTFKPVFDALTKFVERPNRRLIFTLGNHDLELALPWVRDHFVELIAGDNDAAKGRITLALDGAGYSCSVGGSSILCVHGNEVDTWNVTDYERLRRLGRDYVQGRPTEAWAPNAGTKLVIDVMNSVKAKFPFVDLLKPEVEAVVPVVLAMDPTQIKKLARLTEVGGRLAWDSVRRMTGFLSAGEEAVPGTVGIDRKKETQPVSTGPLDRLLADTFSRGGRPLEGAGSQDLMKDIETGFERRIDPLDLVSPERQGETLGGFSAAWDWITRRPTHEVLREALEKLKEDQSFNPRNPDSPYRRIDELMGIGFDYLITGHTHQERSLGRSRGRGAYFNSGTWVALMHFTADQLSSDKKFEDVFKVLRDSRTIAELERYPGLVERKPAAVSITLESNVVKAQLRRVSLANNQVVLTDVDSGTGGN
jgi:UDP-2,3-diacylglucosamine pyrophosphatase LpxH